MRTVAVNDRGVVIGQDHHRAILTDHEIELIRTLRQQGMLYREIAEKMEIARSTAYYVVKGERRSQTIMGTKTVKVRERV